MKEKRTNLKTEVRNANSWGNSDLADRGGVVCGFSRQLMFAFSHSDISGLIAA
jgi:hypothetical protein